jgi:hypothetical protein
LVGKFNTDTDQNEDTAENLEPSTSVTTAHAEVNPTYQHAMRGPLSVDYKKAMEVKWKGS